MKLKIFTGERIIVVICVPSFPRIENFAIIKKICPSFFIPSFLVECLCDFLRKLEASGFIRVWSNGTMRIDSVRKISSSRTCKELAIDFNWLVIYRGGNSTIKGRNLINQRPTSVCPRLEKFGNRFHWRKPWRLEVTRKSKVTNNLYSTHSRFDLMLEKFHLLFLF